MTETLYPVFYGNQLVTLDRLKEIFTPHLHPEAARRFFNFLELEEGKFGVGGGYRPPGTQPSGKPGFAPPGKSFHEGQVFPSGRFYAAWDVVCPNPGRPHRAPNWSEVPVQGSKKAMTLGVHMNTKTEAWHMQPTELDGYDTWVQNGRPDLEYGRIISGVTPPVVAQSNVVYKLNSTGSTVQWIQYVLSTYANQSETLKGDDIGTFGLHTMNAVQIFQQFFGLTTDGIVGEQTFNTLRWISVSAGGPDAPGF